MLLLLLLLLLLTHLKLLHIKLLLESLLLLSHLLRPDLLELWTTLLDYLTFQFILNIYWGWPSFGLKQFLMVDSYCVTSFFCVHKTIRMVNEILLQ